jgi:uncharacterized membrane protein
VKKPKPKVLGALDRALPYVLIVCGIIGSVCAFVILYEKLQLLANPQYHPSCSINPVISCGSVMESAQSHVFGFPNPIIGLLAFPVVTTVGVAMLAGATFKRWLWLGLQFGTILGLIFIHWLFFSSVYRIHALCPYCIVVWLVTFAAFWYVLLYNLRQGHIKTPAKLRSTAAFMQRHHADIYIVWVIVIAALILHHFWYYFGRHL